MRSVPLAGLLLTAAALSLGCNGDPTQPADTPERPSFQVTLNEQTREFSSFAFDLCTDPGPRASRGPARCIRHSSKPAKVTAPLFEAAIPCVLAVTGPTRLAVLVATRSCGALVGPREKHPPAGRRLS